MDFIADNLTLLLFTATLIVGFFLTRRNHSLNVDTSLVLVWQSVAFSLTLTYIIGTFDYVFFQSSYFGFGKKDVAVIIIPGIFCLAILAVSVFYKYVCKLSRKGKNDGGDR